jgi:hypothetical protein
MATKAQRSNSLHDPVTVYVSWLPGDEKTRDWVDEFCLQIGVQRPKGFAAPCCVRRTDKREASDVRTEKADEELRDATDMVAVLTFKYLDVNQKAKNAMERELDQFITLQVKDAGDARNKRTYLAPLQKIPYDRIEIGGVTLADGRLIQLRQPGQRFPVPPENGVGDGIYEAIEQIIGHISGQEA